MVSDRLRTLRKMLGLKQVQLAEIMEVSDNSISSWEHGKYPITSEALEKLCRKKPDINLEWLITGNGEPFKVAIKEQEVWDFLSWYTHLKIKNKQRILQQVRALAESFAD